MSVFSKQEKQDKLDNKAREQENRKRKINAKDVPFLNKIRPRERYVFHSDYFDIDGEVATIMSFFHKDGANDMFGPFWGINRIPTGLAEDIQIICTEQISKQSEG